MPEEDIQSGLASGELSSPKDLTQEELKKRLGQVDRRSLAESQEVNPNLVDTGSAVRAHGFVWCNGRRIRK